MKKFKFYLLAAAGAAILVLGGCKEKEQYDETAFEDDLEPLTDDEVAAMDTNTDDEMIETDDSEMDSAQASADDKKSSDSDSSQNTDASQEAKKLDEKGTYTDKDEVAQYIYEYGHTPSNLTAEPYDNAGNMLPVEDGVTYQQCSLDAEKKQKIIFTQDGKRIYYTEDDGNSFDEIY